MTDLPIELAQARKAETEAYDIFDLAVDNQEPKDLVNEKWLAYSICHNRSVRIYNEWQDLGGTSVIDSVAIEREIRNDQDNWLNPLPFTDEQSPEVLKLIDRYLWEQEYDITPYPKDMPIIDFDKIDEIPF